MKSNVNAGLIVGFVIGATVGAAVGYLMSTDKKEEILDEFNEVVGKVKEGINSAVSKYKESWVYNTVVEDTEATEVK